MRGIVIRESYPTLLKSGFSMTDNDSCDFCSDVNDLSDLDLLFTGSIYILDTCCLQVTKVTKGALNASQSEEARNSTVWRGLNTCLSGHSILNSFPVT